MKMALFSILIPLSIIFSNTYAKSQIPTSDQVAILQLHRFNQLQMQMAMMVEDRTKDEKILGLAEKFHKVHRTMNNEVIAFANKLDLDLVHVSKELEMKAKTEYRDDFIRVSNKIKEFEGKELNKRYPEWAKNTNHVMHRELKETLKEIKTSEVKKFITEKIRTLEKRVL
jgi:hypothetical protein